MASANYLCNIPEEKKIIFIEFSFTSKFSRSCPRPTFCVHHSASRPSSGINSNNRESSLLTGKKKMTCCEVFCCARNLKDQTRKISASIQLQ